MVRRPNSTEPEGISSTSKMSFAVAACAFSAAAIGLLINHWMSGWMAAGGMAGIGLFYLAIGLLNLHTPDGSYRSENDLSETSSHRLADSSNVKNRAVVREVESSVETKQRENLVKS